MRSNFVYATVSNVSSGLKFHQQRRRLNQVERDSHRSKLYNDNVRTATNDDATSLIFIYFTSTQGGESHKRLSAANRTVTRALLLYNIDRLTLVSFRLFCQTYLTLRRFQFARLLPKSFCHSVVCHCVRYSLAKQDRLAQKRAIEVNSAFMTGRVI